MILKRLLKAVIPEALRPPRLIDASINRALRRRGVLSGPFKGMHYTPEVVQGSVRVPKMLGVYERELHGTIEDVCDRSPKTVVNIGAGEGYYTVGLAARLPAARMIAFEENEFSRRSLLELAKANGVADRIELLGHCSPRDLSRVLPATDAFILCDVEGDEETLLDPAAAPTLQNAEIVVEIHEFVARGIGDRVRDRFKATHKIDIVWQQARQFSDFPRPAWFQGMIPEAYSLAFMHEARPERMHWLHMRPLATTRQTRHHE